MSKTAEETYNHRREQYTRVKRSLTNQSPNEEQVERIERLREVGKLMAEEIIFQGQPSREQSLALTHLEECVMWGVKAIVLEEGDGS